MLPCVTGRCRVNFRLLTLDLSPTAAGYRRNDPHKLTAYEAKAHSLPASPCIASCNPYLKLRRGYNRGVLQMPSIDVRHPATPEDDFHAEQKREFDRWRVAADIVRRMREAGINCELNVGFPDRH